jgi:hypothetical protein
MLQGLVRSVLVWKLVASFILRASPEVKASLIKKVIANSIRAARLFQAMNTKFSRSLAKFSRSLTVAIAPTQLERLC